MLHWRDTTKNLQHCRVADRQRAVGLFGGKPMNVRLRSVRKLNAAGLGRPELDDAIAAPELFATGEGGDNVVSEIGERKGVRQKASLAATPHAGQGEASRERR